MSPPRKARRPRAAPKAAPRPGRKGAGATKASATASAREPGARSRAAAKPARAAPLAPAPSAGPAWPRFLAVGEQALSVELGDVVDEAVNARVHLLAGAVRRELAAEVWEVVPTYRALLLFHDPLQVPRARLVRSVERLLASLPATVEGRQARLVHVPVCYGGEMGPDLELVATHNHLSTDEVVAVHASVDYRVYMLGFTPGFPYLGGMPQQIATPRRDQPRARIPAGSVGIGGQQTGIYPLESPGGWNLIGRTPLRLFDARAAAPFLLQAGDRLRFEPIGVDAFRDLERRVADGSHAPHVEGATG